MYLKNAPPTYRFGTPQGLRDPDPVQLRDRFLSYPDLHGPLAPIPLPDLLPEIEVPRDLLRLSPVAPLGEHE